MLPMGKIKIPPPPHGIPAPPLATHRDHAPMIAALRGKATTPLFRLGLTALGVASMGVEFLWAGELGSRKDQAARSYWLP